MGGDAVQSVEKGSFDSTALGFLRIKKKTLQKATTTTSNTTATATAPGHTDVKEVQEKEQEPTMVQTKMKKPKGKKKPFYGSARVKDMYVKAMLNFEEQRTHVALPKVISDMK